MLSKNASRIYQSLKKADENELSYNDLMSQFDMEYNSVYSACQQLVSHRFAREINYSPSAPWGIGLTEEGRNKGRYYATLICRFLFKSVVVPIVVAFVTTLITLWIQRLFGWFDSSNAPH